MDRDAFKHFDTETRKALQRTEAALEELKGRKGVAADALRKSSRKLVKKLRGELKQLLDDYVSSKGTDEPKAPKKIRAPKKPKA